MEQQSDCYVIYDQIDFFVYKIYMCMYACVCVCVDIFFIL